MSVRNYSDVGENAMRIINGLTDPTKNQTLLRLLYYTDMNPLGTASETGGHTDVTQTIINNEIKGKLIRVIPRIGSEETSNPIIALKFDSFTPAAENREFKNVELNIEVFCPLSSWVIKNTNLRPFLIMGEIEKALKNKTINGLGKLQSNGAQLILLTDEMSDYEMNFTLTSYD